MANRTFVILTASVVIAGAISFFAGRMSAAPEPMADRAAPASGSSSAAPSTTPPPRPGASASASASSTSSFPPLNTFPEVSFAQQGEDIIIKSIFALLDLSNATYVDIGAHDPIHGNNTYLFYALGSKGVLIEPNPVYAAKLKAARPRDTIIDKGIGITPGESSADYYDFGGDGQENTFSKEQVDKLAELGMKPERVLKMPLVNINDVLAKHFPTTPPTLLSIDTEGFDLPILKSLDFKRFRPPVIIAETLDVSSNRVLDEIAAFLKTQRYVARGATFVNTIFVSEEALARARVGLEHAKP